MVQDYVRWPVTVQNDARWCGMCRMAPYRDRWCRMVSDGAGCCQMVQDGAKLCESLKDDPEWYGIVNVVQDNSG